MSGIFGIFNRNAKAIENETVEILQKAMAYWKPDEENVWVDGPVALGHGMLWNTPESKYENLPLEKDTYILTMDARIDNRDELAKEIELPDRPFSQIGDSEFILGAYKKWGEECPKHLLGDFAFAIWDETKQQLFCARDHVGVKQFYYHIADELFTFANDLKVLTKHENISEKINDEAVANYIVNHQLLSNKITFFEDIIKLPPAHTLVINHSKVDLRCYWRLEDAPKVKLPNAEAYAKKLRGLLEEAVYARMRSDYPMTSHLSGGLDSSSIAVLAARKLKEKGEKLFVYNWVDETFTNDDSTQYEWTNSKVIAENEGMIHNYVSLSVENINHYMMHSNIFYGNTLRFWYEYPIRDATQKRDSRTILSGWGGDELATYHGQSFYSNLLIDGKLLKLFKELKVIVKKKKSKKSIFSFIYHHLFIPFVPKNFYCKMPKIGCKLRDYSLVNKVFSANIYREIEKPSVLTNQSKVTIQAHMLAYWKYNHIQGRIESWSTLAISNRLEYTYPLLDRRIIEFILHIPAEYFVHKGMGRYLFRLASKGLLPEDILWANTKIEPNRVRQLSSLMENTFKLLISNKYLKDKSYRYIELDKLIYEIENLDINSLDDNTILTIMNIEIFILLILSEEKINVEH